MRQIKEIADKHISLHFPDIDEHVKAQYAEAVEILSGILTGAIQPETRIPLENCADESFNRLRAIAVGSYCFEMHSELKSRFERFDSKGGGAGKPTRNTALHCTKTSLPC